MNADKIGRMAPDGTMTEFPLGGLQGYGYPRGIVVGPDGGIWYVKNVPNRLGRLDPATGEVWELDIPSGSALQSITVGPDARLWFTEYSAHMIGSYDIATGEFREYPLSSAGTSPDPIAAGPDGRVWFGSHDGAIEVGAIDTGAAPTFGLLFYEVPPCRLVNTRGEDGPLGGPSLAAGATRTFALAGTCGVAPDASALAVNVTAANPSANGWLRIWAGLSSSISTTALPIRSGRVRANGTTVNVSGDGTASIKVRNDSDGPVDVILDVSGYFAQPQVR